MYPFIVLKDISNSINDYINHPDSKPEFFCTDSRNIDFPERSLFVAIKGRMHDGHLYISEAVKKGVKNFIVESWPEIPQEGLNILIVKDSITALQDIAAYHRRQFKKIPVIGITGSNGKTVIKEWLGELMSDRSVVKSPKSYNSQLGVPISVWQMRPEHEVAVFEAGISQPGEMSRLESVIQPTVGIITNIGDAHAGGFKNADEKLSEKLRLFENANVIIFEEDNIFVKSAIQKTYPDKSLLSWGKSHSSTSFVIKSLSKDNYLTILNFEYKGQSFEIELPFQDEASIQNICHCIALLLHLNYSIHDIAERVRKLQNLPMRLEMKNGISDSVIINDTYNADISSLRIALDFMAQQAGNRERVLIISDFLQTGLDNQAFNIQLTQLIQSHHVSEVIGVGSKLKNLDTWLDPFILFKNFESTETLLKHLPSLHINGKIVLVKGARQFELERVVQALSARRHSAVLEIDMQAMAHNLRYFSDKLSDHCGIVAVIKASGYGSGSIELAKFMEYHKAAYLAVAFTDEGVELRKAGIRLPIMILNPDMESIADMVRFDLEPEVYSMQQLESIGQYTSVIKQTTFGIHIKLDSGMHRLGFLKEELSDLTAYLKLNPQIKVCTIFSHLSSSEDKADDSFSHSQAAKFSEMYDVLTDSLACKPPRHMCNSAAILRFPEYHYDLVRLGLGLYGIDVVGEESNKLERVHTLKAKVIQIKQINAGESVGYNRRGKVESQTNIAVVNIGYADGLLRSSGNLRYSVQINGMNYPIIGNVCMDLIIVDIGTKSTVQVGDEVVIFGKDKPIEDLAAINNTIPYEILSRISGRIKRVFFHE
ncbi:MAG: bifunctional UDP-N-acetylmuramoyl-tripeptide:D-alanyl-D-alanine ligase/alanine racemase [Saprospiraceae bacterium]|nr:bifunctional UDP-N-acetylmuramoyl-tripeptide:D-alanyl-D-alanine ligase/alanine racemase [Saprospiraceae bacterium]